MSQPHRPSPTEVSSTTLIICISTNFTICSKACVAQTGRTWRHQSVKTAGPSSITTLDSLSPLGLHIARLLKMPSRRMTAATPVSLVESLLWLATLQHPSFLPNTHLWSPILFRLMVITLLSSRLYFYAASLKELLDHTASFVTISWL